MKVNRRMKEELQVPWQFQESQNLLIELRTRYCQGLWALRCSAVPASGLRLYSHAVRGVEKSKNHRLQAT